MRPGCRSFVEVILNWQHGVVLIDSEAAGPLQHSITLLPHPSQKTRPPAKEKRREPATRPTRRRDLICILIIYYFQRLETSQGPGEQALDAPS